MLTRGSGAGEFLERLGNEALPFLLEPAPDALLICAGYDALDPDPLASMTLTPADFREAMTLVLAGFPREKIGLGLEGGYGAGACVGNSEVVLRVSAS